MQIAELQKCSNWEQEVIVLLERILRELRDINSTGKIDE